MAEKVIRRIEIEPAANGGHTVTHHYKESVTHSKKNGLMPRYEEPEQHVFGEGEGHEMLAHVANHLKIPAEKPEHDKANLEALKKAEGKFIDEEEAE